MKKLLTGRTVTVGVVVLLSSLAIGAVAGIGGYTFIYAKGWSYMTDDPGACANCHVMEEQYTAWMRSSHRAVAACNDCHTPPGLSKWVAKASNGYHHSYAFTSGDFPDVIQITPKNLEIVEGRCRGCHEDIVHAVDTSHDGNERTACTTCHARVGHANREQ